MHLSPELFRFDSLSVFIGLFIEIFTILILLYSFGFTLPFQGRAREGGERAGLMPEGKGRARYYLYLILTLIASLGAVFSNHLILFIVFWGFLGLTLYLLIGFGQRENTPNTAKKALIIIGGTDALMILGIAIVWSLTGSFQMDKISITLNTKAAVFAYLCLASGAFAKAGAMPFHTWVPDVAEDGPTPVTAFLPASLDKLLGIYFLARISLDIFRMNTAMNTVLLIVGSVTIVAAVMMALIQHDMKRLLGYHAVSQVGYMVLGIGTGNPVGIAGGIFHMLNHAIYKSCLFLSGGAVEKETGTTDLERLGGLARFMPITFITFLIASFAISGVPPFNGFASKWMVYQGVIETAKSGGHLWIIWLVAAMFGSALTLASFMKLVHTIFLGQPSNAVRSRQYAVRETNTNMWAPTVFLAALCIIFGVFAYPVPLKLLILPSVGRHVAFLGMWSSGLATILLLVGIAAGIIIYFLGTITRARETDIFVGGEILKEHPQMRVSGVEFYDSIRETRMLKTIYSLAEKKAFDIYEQLKRVCSVLTETLRSIHTGALTAYLFWVLSGMIVLFLILVRM